MLTGAGRIIAYDYDNRPLSITQSGVIGFVYDYQGQRVKKAGSSTTIYIGKLYEVTGGINTKYIFAGTKRIANRTSSATNYYHTDHLQSSNIITDASGSSVEAIYYFPYGATRLNSGSVNVKHKYTGQEEDPETGLYYYGARYYDPALARFICPDSVVPDYTDPQSLNRYSYTKNNPLRYIDPTGNQEGEGGGGFEGDIFSFYGNLIFEPTVPYPSISFNYQPYASMSSNYQYPSTSSDYPPEISSGASLNVPSLLLPPPDLRISAPKFGSSPLNMYSSGSTPNINIMNRTLLKTGYADYNLTYCPLGMVPGMLIGGLLTGGSPWGIYAGLAAGTIVVTGGVQRDSGGSWYPYVGAGMSLKFFPGWSFSGMESKGNPIPGWTISAQGFLIFGGQEGYSFGKADQQGSWFTARGFGYPVFPSSSLTVYYVFGPY